MNKYLSIFIKNKYIIIFDVVLAVIVALVISFLSTPLYKADTELLIVQKQSEQMDAYTAARAAETLGNSLSKIVYSSSFLEKVQATNYFSADYLPTNAIEKQKAWKDIVKTQVVPETSIMKITTYAPSQELAINIARAITYTLTYENWEYHGGGDNVFITTIDDPVASEKPVQPNFLLNIVGFSLLGLLAGLASSLIIEEVKKRHFFKKKAPLIHNIKKNHLFSLEKITKPLYQVLNHNTFPDNELALAGSNEPITMHDHLK